MRKKLLVLIMSVMLGCSFMGSNYCLTSYAATTENGGASTQATDTIITKYRLYNDKIQYRRWNATKGVWVDPYWITVS